MPILRRVFPSDRLVGGHKESDLNTDGYGLLTAFHRLYIAGVRAAVRERLKSSYGDNWWKDGVLVAVSLEQRHQLERISEHSPIRAESVFTYVVD